MPPPHPPIFQTHLYRNLLKPLPQQIPPTQDFVVTLIGNLVKDGYHLTPGRPAKVDLCLQFLLRGDNALHGAGQRLAVSTPARHTSQGSRGFAGPASLVLQLLPQFFFQPQRIAVPPQPVNLLFPRMQASASACRGRCSSSPRELNDCRRAGRAAPRPCNACNALFVSPLTNLRWYDILIFYGILSHFVQSRKKEGGSP